MIYEAQKKNPEFIVHKNKKSIFLYEKTKNVKDFIIKFNHYSPIDEGKIRKITIDSIYQLKKLIKIIKQMKILIEILNQKW